MVPFAEVVLLTAMEYHREDESANDITETNLITVFTMNGKEENMHVETQWDKRIRPWFPQFKTIGIYFF